MDSSKLGERVRLTNPVPDPKDPPLNAWSAETALLEVERRSASMSMSDEMEKVAEKSARGGRQRTMGVAAAVAAVVVLGLGSLLVLRSDPSDEIATPPSTQAPPTTEAIVEEAPPESTSTTTTQASTTTSVTVGATDAFPGVEKLAFGPIKAGQAAADVNLPFQFALTVPDVTSDFPGGLWVDTSTPQTVVIELADIVLETGAIETDSAAVLVLSLLQHEESAVIVADGLEANLQGADRSTTTIGGFPAYLLDVAAGSEREQALTALGMARDGSPAFWQEPEANYRFYIIEAPEGTLVAWVSGEPSLWDALMGHHGPAVESITFPQE